METLRFARQGLSDELLLQSALGEKVCLVSIMCIHLIHNFLNVHFFSMDEEL